MKKNINMTTIVTIHKTPTTEHITNPSFTNYEPKYDIITPDGYIVCDNLTRSEAIQCKRELIRMDKLDGTYEPHFYRIIKHHTITLGQARAFYRDVRGTFGINPNSASTYGIVYHETIAERMNLPMEKIEPFIYACYHYGITERQGNGMVI